MVSERSNNSALIPDQERISKAWDFLFQIQNEGGARFLISSDGEGWIQTRKDSIPIEKVDLSDFVAAMELGEIAEWRMVDFLVPNSLCGKWRIGMQVNSRSIEDNHFAIFLPFKQELPRLPLTNSEELKNENI